jgi:hypothetical protein
MFYFPSSAILNLIKISPSTLSLIKNEIGFVKEKRGNFFNCLDFYKFLYRKTFNPIRKEADESYGWDNYLDSAEASHFLNVAPLTFHEWVNNKKISIPRIQISLGVRRYSKIDIDMFVQKRMIKEHHSEY